MKVRILLGVLAVFIATGLTLDHASAETMRKIFDRGKIVVGVKADYKPWGFREPSGDVVGMEIDMAQDVADRLGVKLEKVVVVGSNRMEFLNQGKIDLIIATMGDNPKRRKVVGMMEPNYYASGANVLAKSSAGLKEWSDLKGKKICAIQGAYYNKRASQLYKPDLVAFKGVPEVTRALENDVCIGFIYDSTWIESNLAGGKWAGYGMPLETEDYALWAIGVRHDDLNGPFGRFMSGVIYEWLRSGTLLEIEKKWGVKPNPYLIKMKELMNQ
jgi:polar amino acid transport system substrate-binding protein